MYLLVSREGKCRCQYDPSEASVRWKRRWQTIGDEATHTVW